MAIGQAPGTPVDESVLEDLVRRGIEAFNSHEVERFVGLMSEDVVIAHSASPTTLHGRDEVRSFYADNIWRAFPDMRLERDDGPFPHPHAPRFSMAWRASGTHQGPIDPPGLAATGRRVEIAVREIGELRDGLLCRLQIVLDMAELMRQLGVLPAQGSAGERAMVAMQRLQAKIPRRRG
jgi:steroid delta-isomerase-like uncharacterized protein